MNSPINQTEIHQQSADGEEAQLPPYGIKKAIDAFNRLYKLPVGDTPDFYYVVPDPATTAQAQVLKRITAFRHTLDNELIEGDSILKNIEAGVEPVDILVELADWLGDIVIYCISEMRKHGLDPNMILGIIMASNMSKLGLDGLPIYDEHGKVLKGPNYWKPEPMLKQYITIEIRRAQRAKQATAEGAKT